MSESMQYVVKDAAGNIYGPATIEMLRQWIGEHRIIGSMSIAPQGTEDWQLVSNNPLLADMFSTISSGPDMSAMTATPGQPTGQAAPNPTNPYATTYQPNYASAGSSGTHPLAIWSLVCGILSIICCGVITGIAAVIMGFMALQKIKENPNIQGHGMALAGIITGICGALLNCAGIILYLLIHAR